ncbi:MAG: hypothetical protein E7105_12585 [Prevotella sp.]|nr:hypothetical protein [Prevotella sp.]
MKRLLSAALLLMVGSAIALAANTKQTVTQVSTTVSLTDDVDYHISSTTPFTATGSIDIVNTDHAVVILDAVKPSKAKNYLSYIKINGAEAKNNTNCQVKLYNLGTIILPYGTATRPLTLYDGAGFSGESYNSLTEGHTGGYMNDIPKAWNNRIKSFKLKRGYMVTFALKKSGRGYSRCFIAADSDLEVDLTKESSGLMSERISSYRIFKWYDAGKKQLANAAGDKTSLDLLNVQSTYDWGQGNTSLQPDYEWVPNHIYEDWPSTSTIGSTSQSPHTKANNEPRNQGDDHPQDLETILGNWENMMRTGLRLCSPASWDGSDYWNATGFLADFLDEVDKRGWRCDIIDLHCYWPEGNFGNVSNWSNKYKRPIWISEWCWGASWNNNGSFSGNATEASFAAAIKNITTNLNNNPAVERYFYWNGENGAFHCKLTRNGALTQAGQYYSTMDSGLGYSGYVNYVPHAPTPEAISDLTGTFKPGSKSCTVTWTNMNGDLSKTIILQRKVGSGKYETIASFDGISNEETSKLKFTDTVEPGSSYTYRVIDTLYNKKAAMSNDFTLYTAQTSGAGNVQYGSSTSMPKDKGYAFFTEPFNEQPAVVFGSATMKNTPTSTNSVGIINNLLSVTPQSGAFTYLTYQENLWTNTTATKAETSNFISAKPGNGKIGELNYETGYVSNGDGISYANAGSYGSDVVEVTFQQPFAEAPVVMITPLHTSATLPVLMWRVFDVTKEGFKFQLQYESTQTKSMAQRKVCYFAIDKGTGKDGNGALFTVGCKEMTFKSANVAMDYDTTLVKPIMLAQLQSFNYQAAAILRLASVGEANARLRMQVDPTNTDMVLTTSRSATENVGYILISEDPEPVGIQDISNEAAAIRPADDSIFDLSGRRLGGTLKKGIYIINGQKVLMK